MNINVMKFEKYGTHIGVVKARRVLIHNDQDFLDFLLQTMEEADANYVIVEKAAFDENFYDLSTGFAVGINQKLGTHRAKMAIVGDFSEYKDDEFQDFITSCNEHEDLVFKRSINEAISYFAD